MRLTNLLYALLVVAMTLALVSGAVAGASGKACTKVMNTSTVDRTCDNQFSPGKDVFNFPWKVCEHSSHNTTCENNKTLCARVTLQYVDEDGEEHCQKIIAKSYLPVTGCEGHAIPDPSTGDWYIEDPNDPGSGAGV